MSVSVEYPEYSSYLGHVLVEAVYCSIDILSGLLESRLNILLGACTVCFELGVSLADTCLCITSEVVNLLACISSEDLSSGLDLVLLAWELASDSAGSLCDIV